jgi:hypothetical protein
MQDAGNHLRTFSSAQASRAWLSTNHRTAKELLVRCYKVAAKENGVGGSRPLTRRAPSQRTGAELLPGGRRPGVSEPVFSG